MSDRRRLEAPHRRLEPGSRNLEKAVVVGYRAFSWLVAHVPQAVSRTILGRGAQLSYLLWPTKRRWSNANFGHVLGLRPSHPRVFRTALSAYAEYGRYLVEVARLPKLAREHADELIVGADLDEVHRIWQESEGGLIFSLAHLGNAEAVAAGVASRGWPINVLADDSSFPEMFEEFRRTREQWGVRVIPWRNLREIYAVLRRKEMLGLLVDWGYRDDGIPVKLFDAWTTLPAGPATLAAKTGSRILPVALRRADDDRTFRVEWAEPITVEASDPATLQAATQRMADALAASIAVAPDQWYSFKPIWPETAAESEAHAQHASEMAVSHEKLPAGALTPGIAAAAATEGDAARQPPESPGPPQSPEAELEPA